MSSRPRNLACAASLLLMCVMGTAHAADAPASAAVSSTSAVAAAGEAPVGVALLAGRWVVDLRPSPAEPRYDKMMVLEIAADKSVQGTFYDSTIEAGRASASNGRICFAFRTSDGVGPYHTSGCLVGDRILGETWAEHRNFVLNWTATRD